MRWILLLPLLLSMPAWADDEPLIPRLEQLEQRLEQLERRVEQLESPAAKAGDGVAPGPLDSTQRLSLLGWSYRKVQIKFNTYYALDLELHNGYAKAIKEIDGRVQFHNLLGSHLYSIVLTQELPIPAGGSVVDQGSQDNRRLQGESHPMRNLRSTEINAQLIIKKIVFDDNTVMSF
jgi:hypothetical protein